MAKVDQSWETIRNAVLAPDCKFVSFDVFDTLLLRPLWEPYDLFYFLGIYGESIGACANAFAFVGSRRKAEQHARIRSRKRNPAVQDITVDEIYSVLTEMLHWPEKTALMMKTEEMRLEFQFCTPRKSGMQLYHLAESAGKQIVCISDMYLPEKFILRLLQKDGFSQFSGIYVSSDRKKGKYTGDLYECALRDLRIDNPGAVLHIGDNLTADVQIARKKGLQAIWLPKAKDRYCEKYPLKSEPLEIEKRCRLALSANGTFDNPFDECPSDTDMDFEKVFSQYLIRFSKIPKPIYPKGFAAGGWKHRLKDVIKHLFKPCFSHLLF